VLELGPGAADLVAHHALWVVAVIGVLAIAGFAWWWIRKKRKGDPLEG
jgi:LPXTG-motif cell wall-anchored protein